MFLCRDAPRSSLRLTIWTSMHLSKRQWQHWNRFDIFAWLRPFGKAKMKLRHVCVRACVRACARVVCV